MRKILEICFVPEDTRLVRGMQLDIFSPCDLRVRGRVYNTRQLPN
jgi:hypothetical protein